ncbi:MAG: hypothetical protein KDD82_13530, partial [Planctomycetes bacterium]|nr:hypothetical protein [Planctomycetota bacterium]
EPTARAALAPRVLSLVPALEGPANPSLDALYAGTALGLPSLLARVGAAPVDRRAFLAAATAPPARLSVGPLQETLSAREERSQRVHAYTRPNPQHSRWLAAVQEVESRLAGAQAGVKANENYMRNESYYDKVLDGYTERRDRINGENVIVREPRYKTVTKTRLVHDSAMEQRYRQAQAAAEALSARLRELHAQEPPARLPAEAVIEEQRQVWSGEAQRTLSLSVDGASLSEAQRFPAPAYRVRSAGFQGSDLPEENLPAEDSWTTREALLTQAREQFAAELGDALRPHLLRALEARLAEHLAALGAGADEERRWARVLLGLPLDAAEASPLRAALALDPS